MRTLTACLMLCVACARALAAGLENDIALWVGRAKSGETLLEHRADAPMNPASTMKLVTAFAALDTLGPDYRWQSSLRSDAPLAGGVLQGDLWWVGEGDPAFDLAALDALLDGLRLRGIRTVSGGLLLDRAAFGRVASADGFERDAGRVFAVAPDTHLVGHKVAWLHFYNDGAGARAALEPALGGVTLTQSLTDAGDVGTDCDDVRRFVRISSEGEALSVSGALPRACDGASRFVNLLSAPAFAAQAFAARWARLGGQGAVFGGERPAPAGARMLAGHASPPLSQVLVSTNFHSNNTMARAVYLTLGRVLPQGAGLVADAEAALRASLARHGVDARTLVLENGAGLSRRERVSARALGQLLSAAWRAPFAAEFVASVPAAGRDGTLEKRLGAWGPRLRLKTGTLASVSALAGYWLAPDGEPLAVVAIANGEGASAARIDAAVDAALRRVHAAP
ncbi:D-alanyl-D-alanine carboxypeptidase/D-alanyl-D-alanine endopeptidase [Crenobacter caeni]|uniref:D-alanyl-D-alanine carboxypeptidase/D-alanyl-D-alanine-endopeptidase n=1 Tax=Crenobacter caeni TaxID=2705474 RepID=A0A6B2KW27_9NEIS|nr:D-alanyl-D-alanine carboxypeptidase/D-alanyl-D-alanine-endopeptidase [Crenobacter caeni]NDV14294.1 D-alanyl-D-alanine carboxypeptidase/D-alanyl-D-alanine-endopeptidase [Crenobacter caeni]